MECKPPPSKQVSKKSIYIVHRRETSNALNASVRCEQKRLQRLSETVPDSNRVTQVVLAQFHEVLRRLTVQAAEHHDAEFVHDSLRNIQPM